MCHPFISVVIPAYNEANYLESALNSISRAFHEIGYSGYEIIVADDASTDETPEIAKNAGVKVVCSGKRNIGATRNVGAKHASGEFILFMDADTLLNPTTLAQMFQAIEQKYIGGGTTIRWDKTVSKMGEWGVRIWCGISRLFCMPAGSFFFVKKSIFEKVDGFNEELFISEELDLGKKLKKYGRLTILSHPIQTSARKLDDYSTWYHLKFLFQAVVSPIQLPKSREKLDMWYKNR